MIVVGVPSSNVPLINANDACPSNSVYVTLMLLSPTTKSITSPFTLIFPATVELIFNVNLYSSLFCKSVFL